MSIRLTLLVSVSVIALLLVIQSGVLFYNANKQKNIYEFSKKGSESINLLLVAAGNWAVERGVTNSGLNSASVASAKMLEIIAQRRKDGDASYEKAIEQIQQYQFEGKAEFVSQVSQAYELAVAKRELADSALGQPLIKRDSDLLKSWVQTMSNLIMLTQDLRFAITKIAASTDPVLGRQSELKHFSWLMSEYAGRERAIIGAMVSSGLGMDEGKLQTLSTYRGVVETGWDIVQKFGSDSNDDVRGTIKATKEVFFGSYDQLRQSIYEAAINGDDFPVAAQEWIDSATEAIDTILATQNASTAETETYTAELIASANNKLLISLAVLLVCFALVGFTYYVVIKRVTGPIKSMTDTMHELASGNTEVVVPGIGRTDEIGDMAASVQVFKENAIEREQMRQQQELADQRAAEEKKQVMAQLADKFEEKVGKIVQSVAAAATELSMTAKSVSGVIGEAKEKSSGVASSSVKTNDNVHTVASAAEQLSASVNEISHQLSNTTSVVRDSVEKAEAANSTTQELAEAAERIGNVVELIKEISEQINLLALNATIESARAGEAGKGFAVVASEVKNLASQAGSAVEGITQEISNMQAVSDNVVATLQLIREGISSINEYTGNVASAVEEQSATTKEIASSMSKASTGVADITNDITSVTQAAEHAEESSAEVLNAAQELSLQAEGLSKEVQTFLDEVRA